MVNIKDDSYYIEKMLKDIKFIIEKAQGITKEDLQENEVLCDSALFRLIQISENSMRPTEEFRSKHNTIPWQAIKGLRNRIVHQYGDVDLSAVYQTITEDIPEICKQLESLI